MKCIKHIRRHHFKWRVALSSATECIRVVCGGRCTDDSRMQPADDDRVFSCSCCDSPLPADKWTTDDDEENEEKSSGDSRQH